MFDKLIDLLSQIWQHLIPWVIIIQTDMAVRLRFGKFKEILNPGLHWKIPVVDEILSHTCVWTTISLNSQSLTTNDGKNLVIKAVVKYKISGIQTFLLEVWDATDALSDMTQGIIFKLIKGKTWEQCQTEDLENQITKKVKVEAKRWGIEVQEVTLSDLAQIRSIRLINDMGSIG